MKFNTGKYYKKNRKELSFLKKLKLINALN